MKENLESLQERDKSNKDFKNCTARCPKCGGDVYFAITGCYCRKSFKNECDWSCSNCHPRKGATR